MVRNGAGDSKQVEPITPRRWVEVFRDFKKYENKKGYSDLSEMSDQEISKVLKGSFDTDFISEITTWLRDHMDKIVLDGIMKDPQSVYLPQKFINDPAKALILIQNLLKICLNLSITFCISYICLKICHHLLNLQICATMPWSLK